MQPPTRFSVPALLAFARCHPYVCFWIVLFCAFPIFEAGGLVKVIGWVPVAILSALIVNWLRHYLQGLVPRMTSLDPIAWDAHAGGRIAGVICDDEYARLRYEAYTAPELYGMQFLMMILRSLHVVMYMAVLLIGIGSLYVVANHGFNLDDIHAFLLIVR
ncbi:hypothetical protein, partial [Burkholderia cepacia]|uniref:hypothetical protein n=1 Tax=Burkholderia cepacia TaxID=292 RepID=UPI002ABD9712